MEPTDMSPEEKKGVLQRHRKKWGDTQKKRGGPLPPEKKGEGRFAWENGYFL